VLVALSGVVLVTYVAYRVIPMNATTVGFAYLLLILIVASTWGFLEAALASVLATLVFNFFFLPPVGTFTIADPQNWVALSSFLATSLIASRLSAKAKTRASEAVERQRDLERLYTFSRAMLLIDRSAPFAFRRAADHTLIAQLVGRMVRTPLARRVEEDEFLGSVALFLPHYDESGLEAIIEKLEDPDSGSPVKVERQTDLAMYERAKDKEDLFEALAKVPTYVLDNTRRQANTRRLLSLARKLTMDGIDVEAWSEAKDVAVETLKAESARLRKNPEFAAKVSGRATINIKEFKVEYGELRELRDSRTIAVEVTSENIDDLFTKCETILGEGLKDEYWRRFHDHEEPDQSKLELFCILQDPASVRSVQEECGKRIDALFDQYRDKIEEMPSSRREQYARIGRQGADPRAEKIHPPELIEVRKETPLWNGHLFVDEASKFGWKVNTWEETVLRDEMKGKTFAGWLRNIPRKHWALCVPYGQGQAKPMYPDILTFRREGTKIKIDVLDPHDESRGDAAAKAAGLADFARRHGPAFGRIELIRIEKGQIQRLRLHQESVRDKVLKVTDLKHLAELYEQHG
jgi:type III restriction enzyme